MTGRQVDVLLLRWQGVRKSVHGLLRALGLPEFEDLECFFGRLDTTQGHGAKRRSCSRSASFSCIDPDLKSAYPCD